MAVEDPTRIYGFNLPLVGGALDVWGTELNEIFGDFEGAINSIDEVLTLSQASIILREGEFTALENRVFQLENSQARAHYARVGPPLALDPIVGLNTTILWSAPVFPNFDVGGPFFAGANPSRLTVPVKGAYEIRAQITVPTHAGRQDDDDTIAWVLAIRKNATTVEASYFSPRLNDGNDKELSGATVLQVKLLDDAVVGDFYEVRIRRETSVTPFGLPTALIRGPSDHFEMAQIPSVIAPPLATMQWATPMLVGRWARLGVIDSDVAGGNFTLIDGNIYYRPLAVYRKVVLDQVSFRVSIATSDQQNVRIGFYTASSANAFPQALVGQTPDIVLNVDPVGPKTSPFITPITLLPNTLYWLAIAQYRVTGAGGLSVNGVPNNGESIGAHLGWSASADALGGSVRPGFLLRAVPSPLLSGALPDPADLTARTFETSLWPGIANRIDQLP